VTIFSRRRRKSVVEPASLRGDGISPHARTIVLSAALTLAGPVAAAGQFLTDEQTDTAIQAGLDGKQERLFSRCLAASGVKDLFTQNGFLRGTFDVSVSLTQGQIAELAGAARRLYRPFLLSEAPDALKRLAVYVTAVPHEPGADDDRAVPAIEHIILRSQVKRDLIVQPDDFATEPVNRPKYAGAKLQPNKASARFPIGAIREFPPGEFDVVVVTEAGERRCKVGNNDRRRLFGGL
jgi:hypothetical protein